MPRVERPDGAEIEYRIHGDEGALVAVALGFLHPPDTCRPFAWQLAADHRLLTYDVRGTGSSSRIGPYDIETDAADLAAVLEQAGGDALVIALGDGSRRAVRAAAARPDVIHTVVISGELPLGPIAGTGPRDALADSRAVLDALLGLLETDYRTGIRSMLASSGEDEWDEPADRARLDATEAHCPAEAGIPRLRAWTRDDSLPHGRALGDRLWYLHFPGNAWFQGSFEAIREGLPRARFEDVSEGVISSPEENAAAIHRVLAARQATA